MKVPALLLGAVAASAAFVGSVSAAPLAFTNFQMQNGWKAYDQGTRVPSGAIDGEGIVHLRGAMTEDADRNSPLAFTLPLAMRPNKDVYVTADILAGQKGRLYIHAADGGVFVYDTTGINASARGFTSLEGITFSKN